MKCSPLQVGVPPLNSRVRHQKYVSVIVNQKESKVINRILAGSSVLIVSALCIAASSGTRKLEGSFAISTTSNDPLPDEPRDSHFIVHLEGESAKGLYEAMKVAPRSDACGPRRLQHKIIGGMDCAFDPGRSTYHCGFALDIAKQKIDPLAC